MSKPRTPRYWPRMKVRGARRKKMRSMYAWQRFGDTISIRIVPNFEPFLTAMQSAINRMHARQKLIEHGFYGSVTPEQLDMLGTAILDIESEADSG